MAKKLTKGVLNGTKYKETMQLEWNDETYEVEVRALNNKEATQVEELMQEGVKVNMKPSVNGKMNRNVQFDTKENFRGRKQADIKAVALGTTDEEITEEVVQKEFPPKFIKEIADRVRSISGIGNQKEIEEMTDENKNPSDSGGE